MLDLSRNKLNGSTSNINTKGTNLSHLFLQDNKINSLYEQITKNLIELAPLNVNLSGNPLLCDCNTISFVKWAQDSSAKKQIHFHNADSYLCKGLRSVRQPLFKVNLNQLRQDCDEKRPIIIAVLSTLAVVSCVGIIILSYKKRWHVRHFIFRNYQKFHAHRQGYQEIEDYEYDAFILYSGQEEDRLWVHRVLVETLEKKYGMSLHIHLRDFPVGEYIANNVANAIEKSRKVVAVISPNFVRSQWCVEEVHLAHTADPNKLILVLYKDVPFIEAEVPPLLNYLLESKTYSEWVETPEAEKLFWRKLVHTLYD